jgi:hypothetical protein
MARKDFTGLVQAASGPGAPGTLFNPTFSALTGFTGISFPNTGKEVVEIINGATASNYTVNVGSTVGGHAVAADGPTPCPVSNTAPQRLGPFPTYYNQPGTNLVWIDFSSVATVTVAVTQTPGVS